MAMKRSLIHIFWTFLLVLCRCRSVFSPLTDTDNHHSELCLYAESMVLESQVLCDRRTSAEELLEDDYEDEVTVSCLLYPTNTLNCTISFPTNSQLSGSISTCDEAKTISYRNFTLKGDRTWTGVTHFLEDNMSSIMFGINVSLPDTWTICYVDFDIDTIEVLSPPAFTVSMPNGSLVVRWELPVTRSGEKQGSGCFDYQLDVNGELIDMYEDDQRLYEETNANPTLPYKVKLRTQKNKGCLGPQHWSTWSHTFTVDLSTSRAGELHNYWLLMSIVLVLPMILLSVLLLFKRHRVGNIIFPAVPQPAEKYKAFLKNDNAFNLPPPVQSNHSMEHISEVEEGEERPLKTPS